MAVGKDEQIAALLHGHLVVFGAFAAAVDLAIGERIGAQIVRRKRPLPARQRGVLHHRLELRLQQRGIEEEEERRGRIDHVDGGDAAVGEVLLGEEHGRAVHVGGESMRRERLAVGKDGKLRVRRSAGSVQIGSELAIERFAALLEGRVCASASASICCTVVLLRCQ